jgi:Asp-tRNA(Asn)/Glu-tRNA(Gln) amidotransferase A subunit family amidase
VVGKTVTTEFATFHPGPTRNPRNLQHTPGGSSSGSAAAVADWMVPLAFGSQTAGSIVRPAAFCGVVGYKPTFGTVSRVGIKMISDTLDTVGVLARSVPDAALFVAAIAGRHDFLIDRPADDVPWIGLCRTYEWNRAQPETVAVFEKAAARLRAAGAGVHEVTLPPPFAGLAGAQQSIMVFEVAQSLSHENLVHRDALSADMTRMIDAGLAVTPEQYDAARSLTRACRAMLPEVFKECDVLIAPSAMGYAPAGIAATGDPLFNRMWTLLHVPVVHVPVAEHGHALPLGVTIVGAVGGDRATLRAAEWIHATLGGEEALDEEGAR